MDWQTLGQFAASTEIIPFLFSFFLALLSPLFSKFIEDQTSSHLPTGLKSMNVEKDVIELSKDAVRKVGFISSIFIASLNSFLVVARGGGWGIYPSVIFLAGILVVFLVLPRISPDEFNKPFLRMRKGTWLWIISIVLNVYLISLALQAFESRPHVTPVKSP